MRRSLLALMLVVLGVALVGCNLFAEPLAGTAGTAGEAEAPVEEGIGREVGPVSQPDEEVAEAEEPAADRGGGEGGMGGGGGGPEMAMPTAAALPAEEGAAPAGEMVPPSETGLGGGPGQAVSPLQAGEQDDNENFEAYLQYRLDYHSFVGYPVYDRDVSERHTIQVTTSEGLPVLGAHVRVYAGQTTVAEMYTPATGIVYFFPLADSASADETALDVTIEKDGVQTSFTLERGDPRGAEWPVTLDVAPTEPPINLDVLFLLDATGSMSDEIFQLQDNILSISSQVAELPGRPNVRFGLVAYRDRGDEYITQVYDFTPDVQEFQLALMDVSAAGGGDEPESLNEGLHDAIWRPEWRVENTVSLIFLVADAPPHLDYANDYNYADEMVEASRRGIKIHVIASSGLNVQGEYIFRQIAQYTGGYFIFLVYESTPQASGEPGTEHHVQETYTVEDLDELVIRLIEEELANLSGQ